jgi:type IV secretion system protein VirB9
MSAIRLTLVLGCVGVIAVLSFAGGAQAEVVPLAFGGDSRIREVAYDPDQVLKLEGVVGYHLLLELEEGETFVNLGAGDTAAVEVGAEGRHLMLKPKQETVATNLTLLTNKRVYTIEYTARRGRDVRPAVYVVRFRYPAAAAPTAPEPEPPAAPRNMDYWACGSAELRPVEVFDDGVQTHLRFPARVEWPAIFVANADGSEGLVNFHVEGDVAIVHRVARRLVLRRGELVGCVENRTFDGGGRSLPSGTVAEDVLRVTEGEHP